MVDTAALSELAVRVSTVYKGHISRKVVALQGLIDGAEQHFKSTTISRSDHHNGQEVMKLCQSVLQDLYSCRPSTKGRATKKAEPGTQGIAALTAGLTSSAILLNSFIRGFGVSTIPI